LAPIIGLHLLDLVATAEAAEIVAKRGWVPVARSAGSTDADASGISQVSR
jgi:hypothetical protein